MKRHLVAAATLACVALPASSNASTATLRLVAIVPTYCALDILDTRISGHTVTVRLHRECNAAHDVTLFSERPDALGTVSVRLGSAQRATIGEYTSLAQPEGFYEADDELVLTATQGSTDDLVQFASSLSVGVETR